MSEPLKIAIVNDTLMSTEVLRRLVNSVAGYDVVWTAQHGQEAVEKALALLPDIILMDLVMPVMDGVEATRRIMQQSPCAILLVTASVNRFASKVFEAMGHGALDAINTPTLGPGTDPNRLLGKIAMIAKLIGRKVPGAMRSTPPVPTPQPSQLVLPHLLAIGASTGGPQALATILQGIPATSPVAVVIVQHIDAQFAPGLVDWLDQQSQLPVTLGRSGSFVKPGTVTVAGGDHHLVVGRSGALLHRSNRDGSIYCPSVDVFFQSAADHWPGSGTGILLTGMGRDGAMGLKALRNRGWPTIVQDEASSVVYGMPKAAIALGAAQQVLSLIDIAAICRKHKHQKV
jgi:two-component system, chemotaxis family, response regulator WspF